MTSSYNEKGIIIAISLLKTKDFQNIKTLKSLLTFIPNPNHVKDILRIAVVEIIKTNPHSAFWLFQHPEILEPEIQVREIIATELTKKLLYWGYTSKDFYFMNNSKLIIKDSKKSYLLFHQPLPDDEPFLILVHCLLIQ